MSKKTYGTPPALKHGCYSSLSLLPTEDRAAFEKLHRDIACEFQPAGRSEEIIILNLARLIWRRENLAIYRMASHARGIHSSIYYRLGPPSNIEMPLLGVEKETRSPEELRALRKEADEKALRELGSVLDLVEIGDVATPDELEKELVLIERLDGMIARCVKQLLLVRGVKSMSSSTPAETSQSKLKNIA